jgi:hypothetical protein
VSREQRHHREEVDGNKAWSHRLALIGQDGSAGNGSMMPNMQKGEESVVVIGSMPCRLASEVHINGHQVNRAGIAHPKGEGTRAHRNQGASSGPAAKHARVVMADGCYNIPEV